MQTELSPGEWKLMNSLSELTPMVALIDEAESGTNLIDLLHTYYTKVGVQAFIGTQLIRPGEKITQNERINLSADGQPNPQATDPLQRSDFGGTFAEAISPHPKFTPSYKKATTGCFCVAVPLPPIQQKASV